MMRTLGEVLSDMRQPYAGEPPAELLAETCRILAGCADPERAGSARVSALVEEILAAYHARITELVRSPAA